MRHESFRYLAQGREPHVDHDGLPGLDEGGPVQVRAAVLVVAGDEDSRLGVVAVGQRNAGIGRATCGRGHPRNDLETDPVF